PQRPARTSSPTRGVPSCVGTAKDVVRDPTSRSRHRPGRGDQTSLAYPQRAGSARGPLGGLKRTATPRARRVSRAASEAKRRPAVCESVGRLSPFPCRTVRQPSDSLLVPVIGLCGFELDTYHRETEQRSQDKEEPSCQEGAAAYAQ